jgi:hypothetical protein
VITVTTASAVSVAREKRECRRRVARSKTMLVALTNALTSDLTRESLNSD